MTRVHGLLAAAGEVLGAELPALESIDDGGPSAAGKPLGQVTQAALSALERLDDRDAERIESLTALALRSIDLEHDVRRHTLALRSRRHAAVEETLSRLRRLRTSAELLDSVCAEVVNGCGFSRAMLSRFQGDRWFPWMVHFEGAPETGKRFADWIRDREVTLDQLPLESSVVTELRPGIVVDAANDPRVYQPLVAEGHVSSYVVAPITPAGHAIGFLHADYGADGRRVDLVDRDVLWAFAEAFGRLYERVVLLERIHGQRVYVRRTFEEAEAMMASLAASEIELEHEHGAGTGVEWAEDPGIEPPEAPAAIGEELTARELEVLEMMVRGYSNAAIAERLVIKVGTVKSHVKHILRKIGAVNRTEAISRYMETVADR